MDFGSPPIVLECGSGYTKMGFAGNNRPSFVMPTSVASSSGSELTVLIGNDAELAGLHGYHVTHPVSNGVIQDWDAMERFWQQSFYRCLGIKPEEHQVLVTEPPLNAPEAREQLAEVMFETFNVGGLFIGVSAVLALYANFVVSQHRGQQSAGQALTGMVVESGESASHVIPVVDGYVMASNIRTLPLAGRHLTAAVQSSMVASGPLTGVVSWRAAQAAKEALCFVSEDARISAKKYDQAGSSKHTHSHTFMDPTNGQSVSCRLAKEAFGVPEALFAPGTSRAGTPLQPLHQLVDQAVQCCPIDTRRALYSNIVLCGGTTSLPGFAGRLQKEVAAAAGKRLPRGAASLDVQVHKPGQPQHAAWMGGSVLAVSPAFSKAVRSREEYLEVGPSVCRNNSLFGDDG